MLKGERRRELSADLHLLQGFRYARVTIEGKAEITSIESMPISSATDADRRLHVRPSAGQPAGREHDLVAALATSSKCRPTARSATSGSAGPATRRCSRRPPAICTTATTFLRKWLRDVMADQRDGRRHRACRRPIRRGCIRRHVPGFFGSPAGATRSASSRGCSGMHYGDRGDPRRDAAGDGEVGRLRLVDQRRPDRQAAARTGASAASPSATGCSRSGANREAAADHRRRRRGDDLPLHLLDADGEGRRASSATTRIAERMSERADDGEEGLRSTSSSRHRPPRLRRPDVLCAGHSSTT